MTGTPGHTPLSIFYRSDTVFYGPDKCTQTEFRTFFIKLTQFFEHSRYMVVFYHCHNGAGQRRPCVTAIVGFAGYTAATLYLIP